MRSGGGAHVPAKCYDFRLCWKKLLLSSFSDRFISPQRKNTSGIIPPNTLTYWFCLEGYLKDSKLCFWSIRNDTNSGPAESRTDSFRYKCFRRYLVALSAADCSERDSVLIKSDFHVRGGGNVSHSVEFVRPTRRRRRISEVLRNDWFDVLFFPQYPAPLSSTRCFHAVNSPSRASATAPCTHPIFPVTCTLALKRLH